MWKIVISFYLGYNNIKKWKLSDCKQKTSSSVCVIKYSISGFVWKEWECFLIALLPQVECLCCENMLTTLTPLKDLKDKYIR